MSTKAIYIAGKYSGKDYLEIDRNIAAAREAAAKFFDAGVYAFCPHVHSAHFEAITPKVPYEFWLGLDLHFMYMCDAVFFLDGWKESSGARNEFQIARDRGMPCFWNMDGAIAYGKFGEMIDGTVIEGIE